MKLIVGLGNPGNKYGSTRHNAGKIVANSLPKGLADLIIGNANIFMNESGKAVKELSERYKVPPNRVLVIHDDLDIPLGSYKLQFGRGPRIHNGVISVERELGTKGFWRLRVGVENRLKIQDSRLKIKGEEYVLQDFNRGEQVILHRVISESVIPEIRKWLLKK